MSRFRSEDVFGKPCSNYDPGSLLERLLYMVVSVAVVGGPLLVPGISFKGWAIAFFGVVVGTILVICVLAIVQGLRPSRRSRRPAGRYATQ